jgi:hypothetical protein
MPETTVTVPSPQFSSVGDLIARSWERFKISWKSLLLVTLSMYAISFAGVMFIAIVLFGGGALTAFNSGSIENNLMKILSTMAPLALGLLLVYIILMLVIGVIAGPAMILAVDKAEEKPSVGSLLQMGLKLFWPMILTSLLVAFLVLGGYFVFIIPGILISVYLVFSTYEVVLNGQKTTQALKNSATIIGQNFGPLLLRYLAVLGIAIAIGFVGGIFQGATEKVAGLSALINLIVMLVQMAMTGFTLVYMYFLYKDSRALTDFKRPASLTWMWVFGIIGWIIGLFVMMAVSAGIAALVNSGQLEKYINEELKRDESTDGFMNEAGQFDSMSTQDLIEQYGGDLSEEEKMMLRDIDAATQEDELIQ